MKKYQLFKSLVISTPLLITPLIANSCGKNEKSSDASKIFDEYDLSTWPKSRITIIGKQIDTDANSFYYKWVGQGKPTFHDWVIDHLSLGPGEIDSLYDSFANYADHRISFGPDYPNVTFKRTPEPNMNTPLKKVLETGFSYIVSGNGGIIKGTLTVHVQD